MKNNIAGHTDMYEFVALTVLRESLPYIIKLITFSPSRRVPTFVRYTIYYPPRLGLGLVIYSDSRYYYNIMSV